MKYEIRCFDFMTLNQLLILMYCRVKYDAVIVNNVLDGSA